MILQNLIEYYEENASSLAPFGFEYKEISFVILLDKEGSFLDILDERNAKGEGKEMLVPASLKRSGTGSFPNYLWDNVKYVFGIGSSKDAKQQNALEQKRESFLKNTKELLPSLQEHSEIKAVTRFLEGDFLKPLQKHPLWQELVKLNTYLSFSIESTDRLICQESSIVEAFSSFSKAVKEQSAPCLLTGKPEPVTRLHPFIQGVYGAQGSGAGLVSYNIPSAESFGKEQGYNAPIGQSAVFAYTTALNHLLKSPQKVAFGQVMTVLFWSRTKTSFIDTFANFLKKSSEESPAFLSGCSEGPEDSEPFFIHALSPNGARLSLRLSWEGPIGELKKRIKRYCENLEITSPLHAGEPISVYSALQAFSPCHDVKYVQPHLAGRFLFNLLNNIPYPQNLLPVLIEKLSDDEGISHRRVCLIKAYLNRSLSSTSSLTPHLDTSDRNIGYLLGRLFAVSEATYKQLKKKRRTLRMRNFYQSASRSPKVVFSHLLNRHSLHLLELPSCMRSYFTTLKDSILESIANFPGTLSLIDQGRFAVGYYQQKQKIFSEIKKDQLL